MQPQLLVLCKPHKTKNKAVGAIQEVNCPIGAREATLGCESPAKSVHFFGFSCAAGFRTPQERCPYIH